MNKVININISFNSSDLFDEEKQFQLFLDSDYENQLLYIEEALEYTNQLEQVAKLTIKQLINE